jgi:hypothetical protein
MAPRIKYDDIPFEKVTFNGKVFMYTTPGWEVLYPVVDIIRLFKSNTVISYKFGKGQNIIRTYGTQYNHRVCGFEIKNKNDYTEALKSVKCVFIFTDSADSYAETFINMAKSLKILLVCYSNLDKVYHFYNCFESSKITLNKAEEVIDHIYSAFESVKVTKLAELFPDFEIIEAPVEEPKETVLEECLKKLKVTDSIEKKKKESLMVKKVNDANLTKIKNMEKDRKKVVYDDEDIIKKMKAVNIFAKFR